MYTNFDNESNFQIEKTRQWAYEDGSCNTSDTG